MARPVTWKGMVAHSGEFPREVPLPGPDRLVLIEHLPFGSPAVTVENPAEAHLVTQTLRYPDEREVTARGAVFRGGYAAVRVPALAVRADVCVFRRVDAARGEERCLVQANGRRVGTWKPAAADQKIGWRNHYFLVPSTFLSLEADTELTLEPPEGEELSLFDLWLYRVEYG